MDSINLIKLQILQIVAENDGIRTPQLRVQTHLSISQLRRYSLQLQQAGLLEIEPESDSARAAFIYHLGPRTSARMIEVAYESLRHVDDSLKELRRLSMAIDGLIVQVDRHVNQLLEDLR